MTVRADRAATSWPCRHLVYATGAGKATTSTHNWREGDDADLVLLCAGYEPLAHLTPRLRAYASRATKRPYVIGGVDTETIILAELGLPDGSKAVLHYEAEVSFRERWPKVVITDQIYCLAARRLTAASNTQRSRFRRPSPVSAQ